MATVLTQSGEQVIIDLIDGTSAAHLDAGVAKIGWGTGAGTAAKGDTGLFSEAPESRVIPVVSQPAADVLQWVGTLIAAAPRTITNAGLFDAASGGNLIVHGDFAGIALAAGDGIEFTITLEQT